MSAIAIPKPAGAIRSSRSLAGTTAPASSQAVKTHERLLFQAKVLAVVLVIVGSRGWVISEYTNPVPLWDQWGAEVKQLYIPWAEHRLDPAVLIRPHNEHRCLWPRLMYLGLIAINGQWDTQLEMAINALIAASTAAILMVLLPGVLGMHRQNMIMLMVGVLWTVPLAWENVICGFHTQVYLVPAFAMLTIWGLLCRPRLSAGWWIGACCAFAGVFTMGSGFFAAAAVLMVEGWNLLVDRKAWRRHIPSLVVAISAVALGVWLMHVHPGHRDLRAQTVYDFVYALANLLAWPCVKYRGLAIIMYLPTIFLAAQVVYRRSPLTPAQMFVIGLVFWTLLQAVALAYARALSPPANRYVEMQLFGPLANLLALVVLCDGRIPDREKPSLFWFRLLIGLWAVAFTGGLLDVSKRIVPALNWRYDSTRSNLSACQQCIVRAASTSYPERQNLPYPSPEPVEALLRHPALAGAPSAGTAKSYRFARYGSVPSAFIENGFFFMTGKYAGQNVIGSYNQLGDAGVGTFRSQLIEPKFAYLEIPIAGYPKAPGQSLKLVVEESQDVIPIKIKHDPRESWAVCRVRAPSKPFRLVAEDQNPKSWFAFAAPRQLSWLSAANETLLRWSSIIICSGVALFLLATGFLGRLMDAILAKPPAVTAA